MYGLPKYEINSNEQEGLVFVVKASNFVVYHLEYDLIDFENGGRTAHNRALLAQTHKIPFGIT